MQVDPVGFFVRHQRFSEPGVHFVMQKHRQMQHFARVLVDPRGHGNFGRYLCPLVLAGRARDDPRHRCPEHPKRIALAVLGVVVGREVVQRAPDMLPPCHLRNPRALMNPRTNSVGALDRRGAVPCCTHSLGSVSGNWPGRDRYRV